MKNLLLSLAFILLVISSSSLFAQDDSFSKGKKLFKSYCAACHKASIKRSIGPGLLKIGDKRDEAWLLEWTKNSQKLVKSGDPDAVAIFEEYNKIPMPNQALEDDQIKLVLAYLDDPNNEGGGVQASENSAAPVQNDEEFDKGKKLFKSYCAACHNPSDKKAIGPGLLKVGDKHDQAWLIKWIKNSQKLVKSGDPDAVAIFEEYNKIIMPNQALEDDQIKSILAYLNNPNKGQKKAVGTASAELDDSEKETDNSTLYIILAFCILVAGALIVLLNTVRVYREKLIATKNGTKYTGPITIPQALKSTLFNNKPLLVVISVLLVFVILLFALSKALEVGVNQGYAPEQPIKFSHKVHAGDNKIDCNYCHSAARKSKSAGIPSLNICMNCHKAIDGSHGKTFKYNGETYPMEAEIDKIYKHIGFDKNTLAYKGKKSPVKWIKVHNLPDHVYFNHSQHVKVGKLKCQKCHGEVEKMEVLTQHSPLTMRWCIECHQESSVDFSNNGYYKEIHNRMTPEMKENFLHNGKVTVKEMGGWECAKCHY